jgi:hypothetical protein
MVVVASVEARLPVRAWQQDHVVLELGESTFRPARRTVLEIGWPSGTGWVNGTTVVRFVVGDLLHVDAPTIVDQLQRRDAARLRCSWSVSVTTLERGRPRAHRVEAIDVSATGLAVRAPLDVREGERLPIVIFPPEGRPLTAIGEVVGHDLFGERLRLRFVGYGHQVEGELSRLVMQLLTKRVWR